MKAWLYALACVLVPVAWGLAMVWATGRLESRVMRRDPRRRAVTDAEFPPVEYHI